MFKVCVLMSTYNGKQYVEEQILSILNQKNCDICIYIRDDGSNDETIETIKKIHSERIFLEIGKNIGYIKSFHMLLRNAPDYDYYAFADQDDVWFDNKISVGIEEMIKSEASLYCCNCVLTDEKLIPYGLFSKRKVDDFATQCKILNSSAQGCTMIMDRNLRNLYLKYVPKYDWPHDYWITTIALFTGKVIYDERPYMYYRQHGDNATGGGTGYKTSLNRKWKSVRRSFSNPWSRLAGEILDGYLPYLNESDKEILIELTTYRKNIRTKIKLLLNSNFTKNSVIKDMALRFLILLNKA